MDSGFIISAGIVILAVAGFLFVSRRTHEAALQSPSGKPVAPDTPLPELMQRLGKENRKVAYPARDALIQRGIEAVPDLIEATGDTGPHLRLRAKAALVVIGESAVPMLIDAAQQNPNWRVRENIADVLGDIGDGRAYPALEAALDDPHADVRKMARIALDTLARKGAARPDGSLPAPVIQPPPAAPVEALPLPFTPAGYEPLNTQESLSWVNPGDILKVLGWIIYHPDKLQELRLQGRQNDLRRVLALPVTFLVWLPLLIPVLGIDTGIFSSWLDGFTVLLLNVSSVVGIVLMIAAAHQGLIGRKMNGGHAVGLMLLVGALLYISWIYIGFLSVISVDLGPGMAFVVLGLMLAALTIIAGIGMAVSFYEAAIPLFTLGGLIAFLATSYIVFSVYFIIALAVPGIILTGAAYYMMVRRKDKLFGTARRLFGVAVLVVANAALVWILLLGGWWILLGRPEV